MIRTLVAETHPSSRAVLCWLLEQDDRFELVAGVGTGDEAAGYLEPLDAAVLDIALPGKDAFKTVESLRDSHPAITIVVVGAPNTPYLRAAATQAGADGYADRGLDGAGVLDLLASLHARSH